jgi:hypothetical protein
MWIIAGVLVLAFILAGAYLYTSATPRDFVALGTPIQQDDFVYVVTGVGRAPAISNTAASATAHGIFYIVTIRVDNNARRVDFKWDERIPHIVDARGIRYDKSAEGQAALDASIKPKYTIGPGESASFQAVFDLPANVKKPVLALDNGLLLGDLGNFASYRRIGVMLY